MGVQQLERDVQHRFYMSHRQLPVLRYIQLLLGALCVLSTITHLAVLSAVVWRDSSFSSRLSISALSSAPQSRLNASVLYTHAGHEQNAAIRLDFPNAGVAPLTRELQKFIKEHQYPNEGCEGHTFIRTQRSAGAAYVLHVSAMALTVALLSGHIFDWHPLMFACVNTTSGDTISNVHGFLQAPSKCSASATDSAHVIDISEDLMTESISQFNAGLNISFGYGRTTRLPAQSFQLATAPMETDPVRRACLAYLLRLQSSALTRMRVRRLMPSLLKSNKEAVSGDPTMLARTFPLPPWAIALHIRHGDKAREMQLVSTEGYFDTVEKFWNERGTVRTKRVGFVWTEDPDVFDFLLRRGSYTDRPANAGADGAEWLWIRNPAAGTLRTDSGQRMWGLRGAETYRLIFDEWLLNVFLSLECGTFVGTWRSNQDRLLGQLAGVMLPKEGSSANVTINFIEATGPPVRVHEMKRVPVEVTFQEPAFRNRSSHLFRRRRKRGDLRSIRASPAETARNVKCY